VQRDLGQFGEALDHLRLALTKHHEVGDRGAEVDTRNRLAVALCDTGELPGALEQAQEALTLARDIEYGRGEVDALNALGAAHQRLGHRGTATDHHQQALALARDTAHRYAEVRALIGLAAARRDGSSAREAVDLAGRVGYRVLEGQARTVLAEVVLDEDEFGEAAALAARALAIQRETGHRLGEAAALFVLGGVADRTGDPDRALARRREAAALVADIGAVEPGTAHLPGRGLG
jgi:tetratricopeptide (TPR) repeat protein